MMRNPVRKGFGLLALVMALGLAAMPAWADGHETQLMLGTSGGTVTLVMADDGSYSIGGGTGVASILIGPDGSPLGAVAENGNRYFFAMVDGEWMVNFDAPAAVSVTLGTSGEMVSIAIAEDGTYWVGDAELMDGGMWMAANGNSYTLSMMNGMWSASYTAMTSDVTLGMTGEMRTITVAEDGTYWIGDAELMDGGTVMAANGNTYNLHIHDGNWHAEFVMPDPMVVMLGTSGASVTLQRAEDGSSSVTGLMGVAGYTLGMDGTPHVTASNGNRYAIVADDYGMFMAEFMAPAPVMVGLGLSGESVSLQVAEDGSYWLGDMAVSGGETVESSDGRSYTLSMADGMWMATFMGPSVSVMLGTHGGMVSIVTAEDGTYWVGDMHLMDGGTVSGDGGRMYTLSMGEDGQWMATYVMPAAVTVELGSGAGTVQLQLIEDGSWWHGDTAVADGSEVQAANGNGYRLSLLDGAWSAAYLGDQMMIQGTGLTATAREDGTGYDVGGATLPASGMGDIMVGEASYRVWMEDGALMGARYQTKAWDNSTDHYAGNIPTNGVTFTANDEDTPQDESRTGLILDGDTYSMGDLLGAGTSSNSGDTYVADALEAIGKIRVKAAALFEAFPDAAGDDLTTLDNSLQDLWGGADDTETGELEEALNDAFGTDAIDLDAGDNAQPADNDDFLEEIDKIIEALSSAEGLAAAHADDGMWEGFLGDADVGDVFDATDAESTVWLGVTGSGHYGALAKKERDNALDDLTYLDAALTPDDADDVDMGMVGAFAYSTLADTARTRYVQASGTAHYSGGTMAVSGDGVGYAGDISVSVRFSTMRVDGLVTNLATADGEPWQYQFADVDAISLSQATLRTNGTWNQSDDTTTTPPEQNSSITTAAVAGAGRGGPVSGTFRGELVGGNGANAGSEVVGTWSVGANTSGGDAGYLAGGFGAVRGEDIPDTRPAVDDGTDSKTADLAEAPADGTPSATLEDGMLKIIVQSYAWNTPRDTTELTGLTDAMYAAVEDDAETDADERHLTIDIPLAGLFANQNAERTTNGALWVDVVREEIEMIRTKLGVLLETEQLEDEQAGLWKDFQLIVATKLVYQGPTGSGDTDLNPLLDTDIAAVYNKDEALDVIDEVLQALSGATPLDDALDKDGGGVFTNDDGEPITAYSPADMWNQRQHQVKARLGSTDYTRFGVWRVRRTTNAVRDNNWQRGATVADQRGAFAYSPLAVAKIPGVNSPAYPDGSTATYEGSTIAWATRSENDTNANNGLEIGAGWGMEGSIALTVAWGTEVDAGNVGGAVTAVISDLVDPDGDPLVTTTGERTVRQIHISGVEVDVAPNAELVISGTAVATAHFTDFGATQTLGGPSMSGKFVGLSSQGPLAVIGQWGATGLSLANPSDTNDTAVLPVTLLGAFGAELP